MTEETEGTQSHLTASVVSGIKWTSVALFAQQAMRILVAFVLAAALGPENFGIVGQATIFVAFTSIFLDLGFGVTIIQRRELDESDLGTVNWLNAFAVGCVAAATVAFAPAIATFFETPELTAVLRVLSITVILKGLTVVPRALLTRNMRFRQLGYVEVAATIVGGAAGIGSALLGASYWALVFQTIGTDLTYLIFVRVLERTSSWRFSITSMRSVGRYSANVMGAQMLWYAKDNTDNLLIGKYLGPTALANYGLGYKVMLMPIQTFTQVVVRVLLPTFAHLQHDPPQMARYLLRATRGISILTFPLMTGVIVATPVAIPWLLGPKWEPAVVPMQFLAITAAHQSVLSLGGPALFGTGRANWQLRFSLLTTVLSVAAFAVGLRWGINGVAGAFTAMGLLLAPVMIKLIGLVMPVTMRSWLGSVIPSLAACATSAGVFLGLEYTMLKDAAPLVVLIACGIAAAAAYGLVVWFAFPRARVDTIDLFNTLIRSRSGGTEHTRTPEAIS